jgi:hypothetical protein
MAESVKNTKVHQKIKKNTGHTVAYRTGHHDANKIA